MFICVHMYVTIPFLTLCWFPGLGTSKRLYLSLSLPGIGADQSAQAIYLSLSLAFSPSLSRPFSRASIHLSICPSTHSYTYLSCCIPTHSIIY